MSKLARAGQVVAIIFSLTVLSASALASQNCDNNAIIYCGATSRADLINKIEHGDNNPYGRGNDVKNYFDAWGMTSQNINQTVEGTVSKNGDVKLADGTLVGTGAYTVGRVNLPGSIALGKWWQRPTTLSFASDSLPAWIFMENKTMKWAILKACGNPVVAYPVDEPASITPQASAECTGLVASPKNGTAPVTVTFTANADSSSNSVQSYLFDFGDGSSQENPTPSVTHTYTSAGNFVARLRIKTSAGTTDYKTVCQQIITVTKPAEVVPISTVTPATPSAIETPRTGATGGAAVLGGGFLSYLYSRYRRSKRSLRMSLVKRA